MQHACFDVIPCAFSRHRRRKRSYVQSSPGAKTNNHGARWLNGGRDSAGTAAAGQPQCDAVCGAAGECTRTVVAAASNAAAHDQDRRETIAGDAPASPISATPAVAGRDASSPGREASTWRPSRRARIPGSPDVKIRRFRLSGPHKLLGSGGHDRPQSALVLRPEDTTLRTGHAGQRGGAISALEDHSLKFDPRDESLRKHEIAALRDAGDRSSDVIVDVSKHRAVPSTLTAYPRLRQIYPPEELKKMEEHRRLVQRNRQGRPSSEYFFPHQATGPGTTKFSDDTDSCVRACELNCLGMAGCPDGDCLCQCDPISILQLRNEVQAKCAASLAGQHQQDLKLSTFFENSVQSLLVSSPDTDDYWRQVNLRLSQHTTIRVCVVAYGVALGLTASAIYKALGNIKSGAKGWSAAPHEGRRADMYTNVNWNGNCGRANEVLDRLQIQHYVQSLLTQHEMSPAPGAASRQQGETHVTAMSWTHTKLTSLVNSLVTR